MPRNQEDAVLLEEGRHLLLNGASSLGLRLSLKQTEAFSTYLSLLLTWNSSFNLTSLKSPLAIIRLHFIDSLAIFPFIQPRGRILDLGSGAGFPGLPIKVIFPEKELILVESHRKKANFLREVIRRLQIKKTEVIEGRAEKLNPKETGLFGEVVTRAFGSPDHFLQISAPFLFGGGHSLIMHGPKGAQVFRSLEHRFKGLGFSHSQLESYLLPLGNEKRTLLVYIKN